MTRLQEAHRLQCVIDYVHRHANERLTIEMLSRLAGLSTFHFHRRFSAVVGVSVYRYIKQLRMRRAAYEIAFRDQPILEVALSSGYGSHAAFSRAFKKVTGQSPSEFHADPRAGTWLTAWSDVQHRLDALARRRDSSHDASEVTVVDFPPTRVAALEHRGDVAGLNTSLQRFIDWRRQQPRSVRTGATFNLAYGDPHTTPPGQFRFDICAVTDHPVATNRSGVVERTIAGGRYATLRHVGSNATLGSTVGRLQRWLASQGETPRDLPLVLHRIRLFPDVPEHDAVTDVMHPLA